MATGRNRTDVETAVAASHLSFGLLSLLQQLLQANSKLLTIINPILGAVEEQ